MSAPPILERLEAIPYRQQANGWSSAACPAHEDRHASFGWRVATTDDGRPTVVLHCQASDYLEVAWHVDRERLRAFAPDLDLDQVCEALEFVEGVCRGEERAGLAASRPLGERFGFLKAPRSTVLQPGPVHGGLTHDPARQLEHLAEQLVG